jgi:predicted PurR-regulated permease PerM
VTLDPQDRASMAGDSPPASSPSSTPPSDRIGATPAPRSTAILDELTPRQRRTVKTAVTVLAAAILVAAAAAVLVGLGLFLRRFSAVFLPLAVAAVMALVIKPYHEWFTRRGLRPGLAVTAVLLSILLPVGIALFLFGRMLVGQIYDLIEYLPQWFEQARSWIDQKLPELDRLLDRFGLQERATAAIESSQDALVSGIQSASGGAWSAGGRVVGAIGRLLAWVVVPVYFAFFLVLRMPADADQQVLPFLKPETRRDVVYLAREFLGIVVTFFRGQLIVALLIGVLLAVGFTVIGLRYGVVLGLMLGLLNIIPYLGSMVGLAVCLPLAFFQSGGGLTKMALVLAVFTIVQLIEAYLLTPHIMGKRTGLHPIVVIVSFFFWGTALGGLLGMILAVPLTAFLVVLWRLLREKYIEELV